MAAYFFIQYRKKVANLLLHHTLQKLRKEKEAKRKEEQEKQVSKSVATDEKPVEKKATKPNSRRKAKA